jgi:hypothetical protein
VLAQEPGMATTGLSNRKRSLSSGARHLQGSWELLNGNKIRSPTPRRES